MDKEDVLHTYNETLLSYKKEWNNAICSNMDGCRDYHTKCSKSERQRQISQDMQNLEKKQRRYKSIYLQNRKRLTDIESKLMVTKG